MLTIVRCTIVKYIELYYMNIKEKVGLKLKEFRLKAGLSQERLAYKAGLDRTYIPSIEKGERNISITVLEKLSKALNVSIKDFFEG